jgi:hypothetical protein
MHSLRAAPSARWSGIWRNLPFRTPSLRHDDVAAISLLDLAPVRGKSIKRVSLNRSKSRKETRARML